NNCSGCVNSPYKTSGIGNVNSSRARGKANFRKVAAPPIRSRQPAKEIRKAKREKVEELARAEATPRHAAKPRAASDQALGAPAGCSNRSRSFQTRYNATGTAKR